MSNISFSESLLAVNPCAASTFNFPVVYGAQVIGLEAKPVLNYAPGYQAPGLYSHHAAVNVTDISFCNVTITYTHPKASPSGRNIKVQVWLPLTGWNQRLQGMGGGGWASGLFILSYALMAGAINEKYATVSTDAGLIFKNNNNPDAESWALLSPGNVDLFSLQNLASVAQNDAAIMSKSIIKDFYGVAEKFSYFNGCSQGGRQGYMLAQRYPDAYDGIVASAPATSWSEWIVSNHWAQVIMHELGKYPRACELNAITAAAIAACDPNDGISDGYISLPASCTFDATSMVGKVVACAETKASITITAAAAAVANAAWSGAIGSDGFQLWYGVGKDARLTGVAALANTICDASGTCTGSPNPFVSSWLKQFVYKNGDKDITNMTRAELRRVFHASVQEYTSIIGTNDADLSEFKASGGKLISYHGQQDYIIPPGGTTDYYDEVTFNDPSVKDFYRLFMAPGLAHCWYQTGPYPTTMFDAMVNWVEKGVAPDSLPAVTLPDSKGKIIKKKLCPYPTAPDGDC